METLVEEFVPPSVEEISRAFEGQYEILELIGAGNMGAVYKALQPKLERNIAIKVLRQIDDPTGEIARGFAKEAKALAQLDHQHILTIYDFGETKTGLLYFAMQYVGGTDLHQLIQTRQLTQDHAVSWIPQICEALHYAHESGMVHRDIKPGNLLVNTRGRVKIADFGLVRNKDQSESGETALGTPEYTAPEAWKDYGALDGRADIYSLGVVLYEMLTGSIPKSPYQSPSEISGCDKRWDVICLKAIQVDPADRYQTMTEMEEAVETLLEAPSHAVKIVSDGPKLLSKAEKLAMGKSGAAVTTARRNTNMSSVDRQKEIKERFKKAQDEAAQKNILTGLCIACGVIVVLLLVIAVMATKM